MTAMNRERLLLEIRRARGGFAPLLALLALALGAIPVIANGLRLTMPWAKTYPARIAVDDAKGVVPGKQQVRIAGLPVGKITKAQLVDGRPVLTITIKGRYAPLYRDARARLRPKTPLDDLYLNVEKRGTRAAGELEANQILPAERTRTPVDIGRVLDAFDADTRARMGEAIDELGRGLPDHGADFRATLVELAPFLRERDPGTRLRNYESIGPFFSALSMAAGEYDNAGYRIRFTVPAGNNSFISPIPESGR